MDERETEDADIPLRSKPQLVLIRGSAITLGSGFLGTGAAPDANVDLNGTSLEVFRQVDSRIDLWWVRC